MGLNFFSSWRYLTNNCPVDLSGDEAQYWDWSRHLDLSYYSKPPMVAYLIRASCAVLGDTMPAVRFPALVLAVGTSICTYWLTRRLFGSDRLALGAVVMGGIVPLYAAGGMLMTIDPPFFFFWALATCLVAGAVFDGQKWAWPAAGVVAGLGVLTKYAMLLWPLFVLLYLLLDSPSRQKLKTAGPWIMTLIAAAFLTPVVIWNARHHWVSLFHVTAQIGGGNSHAKMLSLKGILSLAGSLAGFLGSQLAAVNPFLGGLMIAGIIAAIRSKADDSRPTRFLVCIGLPLFVLCALDVFVAKVQANWPAPAYFTLLILTAHFIATHWRASRGWFIGAVVFGLLTQPILHDMTRLYPMVPWINRTFPRKNGQPRLAAKNVDMEYKLRGIKSPFADTVAKDLASLPPGSFVLCEAYEDASQLAFYLPGQPRTYFAGSYWTDPAVRRRWTQFDIWPDRALDRPELIGKDAIYIGWPYAPLQDPAHVVAPAFESIQPLPDITVNVRGNDVATFKVWKCISFKGMHRPAGEGLR